MSWFVLASYLYNKLNLAKILKIKYTETGLERQPNHSFKHHQQKITKLIQARMKYMKHFFNYLLLKC